MSHFFCKELLKFSKMNIKNMISYYYYANIFFQSSLPLQLLISFYSWFNNLDPFFTTVRIGNLKTQKEKILTVTCQRVVMEETISEHWGLYIIYAWSSLLPLIFSLIPLFYYRREKTPGKTKTVRNFSTDQYVKPMPGTRNLCSAAGILG